MLASLFLLFIAQCVPTQGSSTRRRASLDHNQQRIYEEPAASSTFDQLDIYTARDAMGDDFNDNYINDNHELGLEMNHEMDHDWFTNDVIDVPPLSSIPAFDSPSLDTYLEPGVRSPSLNMMPEVQTNTSRALHTDAIHHQTASAGLQEEHQSEHSTYEANHATQDCSSIVDFPLPSHADVARRICSPYADWYYNAGPQEQKAVVARMMQLWNFPATPLGMLQATIQVIRKVTPQHARYLLDPIAQTNYGLMLHIAQQTCPKLDRKEEKMAARIKPILVQHLTMKSDEEINALILAALKYEGMRGRLSDDVIYHILGKLNDPNRFQEEQFALYRDLI